MRTLLSVIGLIGLVCVTSGLALASSSTLYSSIVTCQGWIPGGSSTPYNLTVEVYARTSVLGSPPAPNYTDSHGLVTEVHQTTNNFFRRDAQSAAVKHSVNSAGIVTVQVNTQTFSGCSDCYKLTVTNAGPGAGHIYTGSIRFVGDPTPHALSCSADSE